MAFTTIPSAVTGQQYSAAQHNTYVKNNMRALWPYTAVNRIAYASSPTALSMISLADPGGIVISNTIPAVLLYNLPSHVVKMGSAYPELDQLNPVANVLIHDETIEVSTVNSIGYFFIPSSWDGMYLARAVALVLTAGVTNATTIQVRNLTKYSGNDMLSNAMSIASAETVSTGGTVNASYDDVSTNDKIKIYVTAQSTKKPLGLRVILEFKK